MAAILRLDGRVLFLSEDPALIDKDRDALAARLLRTGGLLKLGVKALAAGEKQTRPMTLVEKILQRNVVATPDTGADLAPGKGAFVRALAVRDRVLHADDRAHAVSEFRQAGRAARSCDDHFSSKTISPSRIAARRT